jgi:hypothetical protein
METAMKTLSLLASAFVVTLVSTSGAQAAIKCDGDYQVVNGHEIATPYCGDNYTATVAQQYGLHVTKKEMREDPARRSEVRRMIGGDLRLR